MPVTLSSPTPTNIISLSSQVMTMNDSEDISRSRSSQDTEGELRERWSDAVQAMENNSSDSNTDSTVVNLTDHDEQEKQDTSILRPNELEKESESSSSTQGEVRSTSESSRSPFWKRFRWSSTKDREQGQPEIEEGTVVEVRGEDTEDCEREERVDYPIYFYRKDEPYYSFTNFSPHPVTYEEKRYPTAEHLFQSFKFLEHRPLLAEHIRTIAQNPSAAFAEARRFQPEVRSDWLEVNLKKMDHVLLLKFTQHNDLRRELLKTGKADLIEDSPTDAFWGIGQDRSGRNELGKALMRLRDKLRDI